MLGEKLCGQGTELDSDSESQKALFAMVNRWLLISGKPHSWRSLIWALDEINETGVADSLMNFTEPPRGIILSIGSAVCNSYTTITRDLS